MIRKKILITGVNGYIGNCLYHFLKGKFKVVGIDKESVSKNTIYRCNILNTKKLEQILYKTKPEIVIHLAAQSLVDGRKGHDHLLSRPVIFLNRAFGITPMEQGLRVVGTVEFGGLDNPATKKRITNLVNNAKYLFPELSEHCDEWLGFRPTLPDYLPVMGPSKNYKNLFYSFGHHHLGWTLGAISGKIISGMVAGDSTNLNLEPYSSLRFS